jgi:hypothetical protein
MLFVHHLVLMDQDPGGTKTYGSSGSATLTSTVYTWKSVLPQPPMDQDPGGTKTCESYESGSATLRSRYLEVCPAVAPDGSGSGRHKNIINI